MLAVVVSASAALLTGCTSAGQSATGSPSAPTAGSSPRLTASTPRPASATRIVACPTSQLTVGLGTSGGAAGTAYQQVLFRNHGRTSCTLFGYPGVSFTDPSGRQLGVPARRVNLTGQRVTAVTLAPGQFANAAVGIPDPYNFPGGACHRVTASDLRVYPPDQYASVLVPFPVQVCTTSNAGAFVTPVRPDRSSTPGR